MARFWQYRRAMESRASSSADFARRETAFRRRAFPDARAADWNDWRWQLRNRARTPAAFARTLALVHDNLPVLKAKETRVYTIALSEHADRPLLR